MKRKSPYAALEERIGYRFKDPQLLELALTHPSFRNEAQRDTGDNQRMEFLGDAVIALVCANTLYRTRQQATEGDLTKARAAATCTQALAAQSRALGLGEHLQLGNGERQAGGRARAGALADAFEALVGAIFLDGGFAAAESVISRVPLINSDAESNSGSPTNPKGFLQELVQKKHAIPTYRIREASGPAHARHFKVDVLVDEKVVATGEGPSKRIAEQKAAAAALTILMHPHR